MRRNIISRGEVQVLMRRRWLFEFKQLRRIFGLDVHFPACHSSSQSAINGWLLRPGAWQNCVRALCVPIGRIKKY